MEDNHSWTLSLSITGLVCLVFLLHGILMSLSNHKAFIVFHVSVPLIWTWYTADLLPGTVFSDTSSVGMSQCILTDRQTGWGLRLWFNCCFSPNSEVWVGVAFVFPLHISCKSMSPTCPECRLLQMIPCITKHWIEKMARKWPILQLIHLM